MHEEVLILTLTADALWLNTVFAGYDQAILGFAHKLAELADPILTPLNRLITLLGEKGILFFLLAVVLMLFPRWRKTGVCIFGAVCCGALITNILLKDSIARPRPFEMSELFRQWWEYVGSPAEDGFSFPSGHVTAAAAGVTSLCLMRGRRWFLPGAVWVLLMMFSRNYLMAHYPSDVLFAMFIGIFSGFVAAVITQLIFRFLESSEKLGFLTEIGFDSPADLKDRIVGLFANTRNSQRESAADPDNAKAPRAARENVSAAGRHSSSRNAKSSASSKVTYQGKH